MGQRPERASWERAKAPVTSFRARPRRDKASQSTGSRSRQTGSGSKRVSEQEPQNRPHSAEATQFGRSTMRFIWSSILVGSITSSASRYCTKSPHACATHTFKAAVCPRLFCLTSFKFGSANALNDVNALIRRTVVDDNDLDIRPSLTKYGFKCLADVFLGVVAWNENRNFGRAHRQSFR